MIFGAATDGSDQLRYVVGADAEAILERRLHLGDVGFLAAMRAEYGLA